jgi:GMC oxidoreductase
MSPSIAMEYDFIVVGGKLPTSDLKNCADAILIIGGTAGNVVAGRLAENPKVTVLVIEAGKA